MPEISIPTELSEKDLDAIVQGVVMAIKPLLEPKPELVSADQMASIAGISPATLERLRKANKVPSCKILNRRLYRPEAVIAAIEAKNRNQEEGSWQ